MKITVKVKSDFEQQNNVSSDDFEDIISDLEKTGENLSERYLKEDTITEEEARELAFKYTPEGQEISKYGNTIENINNRAEGYIEAEERHEEQIAKENEVPNVEKLDLLSDEVTETIEEAKEPEKKKNKIPYRNYLILFVIITSLSACFTFSRYITNVNSSSTGVVAKFDVVVTSDKPNLVFDRIDQYSNITFTVENKGEVAVNVDVTLTVPDGLTFQLDGVDGKTTKTFEKIGVGESRNFVLKVHSRENMQKLDGISVNYTYEQCD